MVFKKMKLLFSIKENNKNIIEKLNNAIENNENGNVRKYCKKLATNEHEANKLLLCHYRPNNPNANGSVPTFNFKTKESVYDEYGPLVYNNKLQSFYDGNPLHLALLAGNIQMIKHVSEILEFNQDSYYYILNSNQKIKVQNYLKSIDGGKIWFNIITIHYLKNLNSSPLKK